MTSEWGLCREASDARNDWCPYSLSPPIAPCKFQWRISIEYQSPLLYGKPGIVEFSCCHSLGRCPPNLKNRHNLLQPSFPDMTVLLYPTRIGRQISDTFQYQVKGDKMNQSF